jgi:hypothetical protein
MQSRSLTFGTAVAMAVTLGLTGGVAAGQEPGGVQPEDRRGAGIARFARRR